MPLHDIGKRALFNFSVYSTEGHIVGVKDENDDVWFLPDPGFCIPDGWDMSIEYPGAFATSTEYLEEIEDVADMPDINPDELEALLNM